MKPSVIYVSYDGMLEPLGQSQVISYLRYLSDDYSIRVISFEKPTDRKDLERVSNLRKALAEYKIKWVSLTYHKNPSALATAFDVLIGVLVTMWFSMRDKVSIIHARSYVPALIVLPAKFFFNAKFLFDIRGFWADERTDGGIWSADGALYRFTKLLERNFFNAADHVVTLTNASEKIIGDFDFFKGAVPPISVIPTCADLEIFCPQPSETNRPFTFGYVGSIGTWYLFDETMAFFKVLLKFKPDAKFLIVNRHEHSLIRQLADKHQVDQAKISIVAVEHYEVPQKIVEMHAAAALIKPCYSKLASAPTKLAEYLGCGVPCLGNSGVGDMEFILATSKCGVVLKEFSEDALYSAAKNLVKLTESESVSYQCRNMAEELFSLSSGVVEYKKIYDTLSNKKEFR